MIGERLKKLRNSRGWTQEQTAKKMNLLRATLAHHENNINKPKHATIAKYAKLYNTTVSYILGETDNPEIKVDELDLKAIKNALSKDNTELRWGGKPLPSADQEYLKRILEPILERVIKAEEEKNNN